MWIDSINRLVKVTGADTTRELEGTRYFKVYATNGNLNDEPSDLLTIDFVDPCRLETFTLSNDPPVALMVTEVAADPVLAPFSFSLLYDYHDCGDFYYTFQYAPADTNSPQPDISTYLSVNEN